MAWVGILWFSRVHEKAMIYGARWKSHECRTRALSIPEVLPYLNLQVEILIQILVYLLLLWPTQIDAIITILVNWIGYFRLVCSSLVNWERKISSQSQILSWIENWVTSQPGKATGHCLSKSLKVIIFRSFSDFLLFARRNAGQPKHLIQLGGYQIR